MSEKKVEQKKAIVTQALLEYKKEAMADGRGDIDIRHDLDECLLRADLSLFTAEI